MTHATKHDPTTTGPTPAPTRTSVPTPSSPSARPAVAVPGRVFPDPGASSPATAARKQTQSPQRQQRRLKLGSVSPISTASSPRADTRAGPLKGPPVAPSPEELEKQTAARRSDFAKLQDDDHEPLALEWGWTRTDRRAVEALRRKASFDFVRGLTSEQRQLVKVEDIRKGEPLPRAVWAARRAEHVHTLNAEDKKQLAKTWELSETDPRFVAALQNEKSYQFFRRLETEHRLVARVEHIKAATKLSEQDWTNVRRERPETLNDADQDFFAAEWQVPRDDPRFAAALRDVSSYGFYRRLAPEHRRIARIEHIKAAKDLSEQDWTEVRRERLDTLNDADREYFAKHWQVKDDAFEAATASQKSYEYVRKLVAENRRAATPEQIRNAEFLTPEQWHDHRLKRCETLSDTDKDELSDKWGVVKASRQFNFAMANQRQYDFIRGLPAELVRHLPSRGLKENAPDELLATTRKKAVAKWEEVAEQEQSAAAKVAADNRRRDGLVEWDQLRGQLQKEVGERVTATMPGFSWQKRFDEIIGSADAKIQKDNAINIGNQINTVRGYVTRYLDDEQKRRDVEQSIKKYPNLQPATVREIKEAVLTNHKLGAGEFDSRANQARQKQRNPEQAREWARLLRLVLYHTSSPQPFEPLTQREGLGVHMSVGLDGITVPVVTDATTPDQLLDALFGTVRKNFRLHVTLETGVEGGADQLKLPHRYWNGSRAAEYELRYKVGDDHFVRWGSRFDEARIKKALDAAYAEMHDTLRARAKTALDRDCYIP